jgi:hypothetical protein
MCGVTPEEIEEIIKTHTNWIKLIYKNHQNVGWNCKLINVT